MKEQRVVSEIGWKTATKRGARPKAASVMNTRIQLAHLTAKNAKLIRAQRRRLHVTLAQRYN